MKTILPLGLAILMLLSMSAIAQQKSVTGIVTSSEDGATLPGVTITAKGNTAVGTVSDSEGKYTLPVPAGVSTLVYSYIGMTAQEVAINDRTVIDIVLVPDTKQLSEVVVTAIGIEQNKKMLGYSVQNVKSQDVVNAREANLVNALAGKVAGVQVFSSGGQAGSSARITIRGNSSFNETQPLFIVDGIPIDNRQTAGNGGESVESDLFNGTGSNRVIDIDPNIIESTTVLKGAAATALYGSRGANGVIMITTKKGKKSTNKYPNVSVTFNSGFNDPMIRGFQDQYLQGVGGNYRNGLPPGKGGFRSKDPLTNPTGASASQGSTSWGPRKDQVDQYTLDSIGQPAVYNPREDFYRNGTVNEQNFAINGGGDVMTYYFSYSHYAEDGIVPGNDFKRNSFLGKIDANLTPKLKYSGSINYVRSDNSRLTEGNGERSFLYGLNFWPISHDITKYETEDGEYYSYHPTAYNNPFWLAKNNGSFSDVDRFIINQTFIYEIAPGFMLTNRFGYDGYADLKEEHVNIGTRGLPDGRMYTSTIRNNQVNDDLFLTVDKKISDKFAINGLVGANLNSRYYKQDILRGLKLSVPGFYDISNASTVQAYELDEQIRSVSLLARAQLSYDEFLYLDLTGRNDWSSTLPKDDNSYFYSAAALGFVFTRFIPQNNIFTFGKLRASIAQAGNAAQAYQTTQNYSKSDPGDGTRGIITIPTQGQVAFENSNVLSNPNLTNELITEYEFGTELQFFNNRASVDLTYYHKVSNNQIVSTPSAPSTGYVQAVKNVGEIVNKGIELTVNATPVKLSDGFQWDLQLNFARNRQKVNELAPGVESVFLYGFTSPQIRADVQNGYGVIWGAKFERNDKNELLIDDEGYPIVSSELGAIGNVFPDWTAGLRNSLSWKGLRLSALFDMRRGGDVLNMDLFYSTFYGTAEVTEDRGSVVVWKGVNEAGQPNTIPIVKDAAYYQNFYSSVDELFVEDGSFVKLRELSLSYSLPRKLFSKTPFQTINLSVVGRNLYIDSNFSYWDPEGNLGGAANGQGFYHGVTPGTRSLTFGLNFTL